MRGPWSLHRLSAQRLPWLGHWRAASGDTIPHRKRRVPWPRRPPVNSTNPERDPVRLYALSDLVLDLDAEDCKNVRGFDPEIDGVPETPSEAQRREEESVTKRIDRFKLEREHDEQAYQALRKLPFSPWHITSVDILSTVLEGTRSSNSDAAPKELRHLAPNERLAAIRDINGIPKLAQDTTSNLVPYMLHRQKCVDPPDFAQVKLESLQKPLTTMDDLWEVQRFLLQLMKTRPGCLVASQLSPVLSRVLRRCAARAKPQEVADILALTNNVSYALTSMRVTTDPTFTGLGLSLAMKCAAFPAARMYLENGLKSGQWDMPETQFDLDTSLAQLLWLLSSYHRYTNDSGIALQQQVQAARLAAYGLLTGYHVGGQLTGHCYRSTFPSGQSRVMPYWKHYLHVLGELGAFRTLWHEFQAVMRAPNKVHPSVVSTEHLFYSAILRAVRNIQSRRISFKCTSLTEASGDYSTDCELDLRTIMLSYEGTTSLRDDCSENIEPGHLQDVTQPETLAELYSLEEQPKLEVLVRNFFHHQNLRQAMSMLRRILFPKPPPRATDEARSIV